MATRTGSTPTSTAGTDDTRPCGGTAISISRPAAASAPLSSAAVVPSAPYRNPSSNSVMPTAAATTGFTTVSVASGAVSPAPR